MNQAILDKIESEQYRKNPAEFGVGDTVRVHTKVVEGDKERIQIFSGVVIGRRGHGINETFTVRRIRTPENQPRCRRSWMGVSGQSIGVRPGELVGHPHIP